jgi:hypothetical protein
VRLRPFILRVLGWLLVVVPLWVLLTPIYNRLLTAATESLVRLSESPNVTRLLPIDSHRVVLVRTDFPPAKSSTYSMSVTNLHFHMILLGAMFLAVPDVRWRQRLARLGVATLVTVAFDLVLFFFWVKFVYATQLGSWSLQHYGAFARNFWGLGKHLLDLPFKFGLPLALWVAFYLPLIRRREEPAAPERSPTP